MTRASDRLTAERIWRPQAQTSASVRFTTRSAEALSRWLDRQSQPAHNANQALNMAFESLDPVVTDMVTDTRATIRQLRSDLDDMKRRLVAAEIGLDELERKVGDHGM
ncbi:MULTISPECIES: hypothetical protein [Acidiphilium]|uniref:Uncharacterized protein n=1 Tax=Acidiphilium rubrum TaxID=526 RepID=A0A8G2CMR5_ACIRU|nr:MULTISPECIES: hypothetical protein [Acidiphilium]SIR29513.1 hypothetical protein SAMN05421828_12329 [Acidiphilium rubrum]